MADSVKVTLEILRKKKEQKTKAVGVSCYTAPDAAIAAAAGVDFIVVGDSLAMTLLGFDSTLPATMDMMELFTAATRRSLTGSHVPLVVGDMPLGSYQPSDAIAVENACRLVQAGADVVKIEGGTDLIRKRIRAISEAGIGVVAHLGLQPQQKALVGGWRVQAKTADDADELGLTVDKVFDVGAVITLIEAVPREVGAWLTRNSAELIYGIGAGPDVDGQLLVMSDLVGEFRAFKSRFAKRFGDVGLAKTLAMNDYVSAVRTGKFPDAETSYSMDPDEAKKLETE